MFAPAQAADAAAAMPPTDAASAGSADNSKRQQVRDPLAAKIGVVSAPPGHLTDFPFARDVFDRLGPRGLAELVGKLGPEQLLPTLIEAKVRRHPDPLGPPLLRAVCSYGLQMRPIRILGRGIMVSPAEALTKRMGGRWHGSYGAARRPVHDDRDPSLSIRDGERSVLVKCYAGSDPHEVVAALQRDRRWRVIRDPHPEKRKPKRNAQDTRRYLLSIWHECRLISGTPAERYLRGRDIAIDLPPVYGITPRSSTPTSAGFSRACGRKRAVAACAVA
jgi:hypothetical protein